MRKSRKEFRSEISNFSAKNSIFWALNCSIRKKSCLNIKHNNFYIHFTIVWSFFDIFFNYHKSSSESFDAQFWILAFLNPFTNLKLMLIFIIGFKVLKNAAQAFLNALFNILPISHFFVLLRLWKVGRKRLSNFFEKSIKTSLAEEYLCYLQGWNP